MAKKSLHFIFHHKKRKRSPRNLPDTPPNNDGGATDSSPRFTDPPADAVRATGRFFVDVGPTGSLVEEARMSAPLSPPADAVMKESADPCADFRRSMEEMVGARYVGGRGPLDWGYLAELLGRYLELNEQGVHECIMRAFVDLTVSLRRRSVDF